MKKSVDFSAGIRGKHTELNLKVLGAAKFIWAVCLTENAKDLIPFKLYRIEVFSGSDEVRSKNETGETAFYPKACFEPVEVSKKTLGLLERAG
ncbi:hypothetical protein BH10ACI3_BH10ACI3_27580 [soil metagenome]